MTTFFTAPTANDPLNKNSIFAIIEDGAPTPSSSSSSSAAAAAAAAAAEVGGVVTTESTSVLARVDLITGQKTVLYKWNSTVYRHLCHCSLPIRPQDQADLAVSADGKTVWVVLSYNGQ